MSWRETSKRFDKARRRDERTRKVLHVVLIVFAIYVLIAATRYRFRNPDQTETELFKNLPEALAWR